MLSACARLPLINSVGQLWVDIFLPASVFLSVVFVLDLTGTKQKGITNTCCPAVEYASVGMSFSDKTVQVCQRLESERERIIIKSHFITRK